MARVWVGALLITAMVGAAGCGGGETSLTSQREVAGAVADAPVTSDRAGESTIGAEDVMEVAKVQAWAAEFEGISRAAVDAWDTRDLDAIRALYTDDVVHDDARFGTYREGIDDVIGIAEAMFAYQTPDVRFAASSDFGSGFIGGDGGIMVWEAYEVFGYTRESPLVEVDRLTVREGRIAHWELLYETSDPHEVIAAYSTAWASGDASQVAALYEASAIREDTVLRSRSEGLEALKAAATRFFVEHPDATWELLLPFGAGNTHGALFDVTDESDCPVRVVVLTRLETGLIAEEEIYYHGTSLLACDWLS